MIDWMKQNSSLAAWWAVLLIGTAIFFGVSRGTSYGQLGVGLLSAAIVLFVLVAIFELIWRGVGALEEPKRDGAGRPRGRR